jgi:hypothetical protein
MLLQYRRAAHDRGRYCEMPELQRGQPCGGIIMDAFAYYMWISAYAFQMVLVVLGIILVVALIREHIG